MHAFDHFLYGRCNELFELSGSHGSGQGRWYSLESCEGRVRAPQRAGKALNAGLRADIGGHLVRLRWEVLIEKLMIAAPFFMAEAGGLCGKKIGSEIATE